MKRRLGLLVVIVFLSCAGERAAESAGSEVAHFEDPVFGFSVDVPSIGDPKDAIAVQRLLVGGPAVNGFAPNCNVQVQYTDMDIGPYMELSRKQFVAMGLEVVEEARRKVSGLPAAATDYVGPVGGRDLRFASLAVVGTGRVWLVTCAALADSYAQHEATFSRVLESFRVTGEEAAPESP